MSAIEAAEHLRSIADALIMIDPEDVALDDLEQQLLKVRVGLEASAALAAARTIPGPRRWEDTSTFSGRLNVVAPPLKMWSPAGAEPGLPLLHASVTLGPRYEGPRGAVHGGIVAGMIDELLGATVSRLGSPVVTGTLKLRYPGLTPLGVPLTLRAWVTEDRGRAVIAKATVSRAGADHGADADPDPGVITAKAEAMFVRVPRDQS